MKLFARSLTKLTHCLTLIAMCAFIFTSRSDAVWCAALNKDITCPNGDHPPGSTPHLGNLFTINRTTLRAAIRCCGGSVNFDRLWVREESQSGWPGFHVHWDYDTNSSASCYTKNFNLHILNDDCPGLGKVSSCPKSGSKSYLSGADYFEYLCRDACQLYEGMTGRSCSEIVDQVSSPLGTADTDLGRNDVAFALGDPDRRKILQGAVDGLNELLPYANVEHCGLTKVSSLNLGRVDSQIDYLFDRGTGDNFCLEGELCWARRETAYSQAKRDQMRIQMDYTCEAYKYAYYTPQASDRFLEEWKSIYSKTKSKTFYYDRKYASGDSVYSSRTSGSASVSFSESGLCRMAGDKWICQNEPSGEYPGSLQGAKNNMNSAADYYRNSANQDANWYSSEVGKMEGYIRGNTSCRNNANNKINSNCPYVDSAYSSYRSAYNSYSSCYSSCRNQKNADGKYKSSSECDSQCNYGHVQSLYNTYSNYSSNCSSGRSEYNTCVSNYNYAVNNIGDYSYRAAFYRARAELYDEHKQDYNNNNDYFQYRIYYRVGQITASYGNINCANNKYYEGQKFGDDHWKPYYTQWYSHSYNRDTAVSNCRSITRSKGYDHCIEAIDELPRQVRLYKYSREWSEQTGNDNYYCTNTSTTVCSPSTKNGGCHTNPERSYINIGGNYYYTNGLTKRTDDKTPHTWSYNGTTMNVRCYKKSRLETNDDIEWMKSHISLPGFIESYIKPQVALIIKRKDAYYKTIPAKSGGGDPSNAWFESWRKAGGTNLCSNKTSINTRGCVAVNLLQSCLNKANSMMQSNTSDVTHKSEGILTTYQDNHACTGDNDAVSSSRCYKFGCYVQRETCRNVDQFFVDYDEVCSVGTYAGSKSPDIYYNQGTNKNLTCRNCAAANSCSQAAAQGYRYDPLASNPNNTNVIMGFLIDDKNASRYKTILTSCPAGQHCETKTLRYKGKTIGNCLVVTDSGVTCASNGLKDFSSNACAYRSDGHNTPVPRYINEYDTSGNIIKTHKCWTGECVDSCVAAGYYTWSPVNTTNCTSTYQCIDGSGYFYATNDPRNGCAYADTLAAHALPNAAKLFYNRVYPGYCFNAHCRATPPGGASISKNICIEHGYAAIVGDPFSCGPRETSLGIETITYYENGSAKTQDCYIGCRLNIANNTEQCTANTVTGNNTPDAGAMLWFNHQEDRYQRLPTYLIKVGERTWCYADKAGHNGCSAAAYRASHLYQVAAKNGMFTPASINKVSVCRFDRCAPSDASITAQGLNEEYEKTVCASLGLDPKSTITSNNEYPQKTYGRSGGSVYIAEVGGLYDSCDGIYLYNRCVRQNNSCAPRCRKDTDLGYGTYEAYCQHYNINSRARGQDGKYIDTTRDSSGAWWTRTDTCDDGSYSTQTDYHSEIACNVPTCADGWTLAIDKNETLKPTDTNGHTNAVRCGQTYDLDCNHSAFLTTRSSTTLTLHTGVCYGQGGTIQCAPNAPAPQRSPNRAGCHTGNTSCYKLEGCATEYDNNGNIKTSTHPTEFGQPNESGLYTCGNSTDPRCNINNDFIFIPAGRSDTREAYLANYGAGNAHYKAGTNGRRCGRYMHVSAPKWATATQNPATQGAQNIYVNSTSGTATDRCPGAVQPFNSSSFTLAGDLKLDWNYFNTLVDVSKLEPCANISGFNEAAWKTKTANMDGYYACREYDSVVTSSSLLNKGLLDASRNVIVFFDDPNATFRIDTNIVTDIGSFKAFISRGSIVIDPNVGKFPKAAMNDHGGCSSETTADLQGFFAAKQIRFDHMDYSGSSVKEISRIGLNPQLVPFNDVTSLYCDKQVVIAGNIVQWGGGGIQMNRTFKGCVGGNATTDGESSLDWEYVIANPAAYPDYNAFLSPVIIYQRSDFNSSVPNWLKTNSTQRIESR